MRIKAGGTDGVPLAVEINLRERKLSTTLRHLSDASPLLTLDETAALLRYSKAHASKLTRGKIHGVKPLPAIRLGRRVLVRREDLLQWLSHHASGTVVR